MKENVLDVLIYLFENYIDEDTEIEPDRALLQDQLIEAGFPGVEIEKAFDWLENLANLEAPIHGGHALRVYTARESEKLNMTCQGFLLFLEQNGVLDPPTRELVIDRVMALESDEINLDQLKWVVLMVLFNQPGQEAACTWIEDMVLDAAPTHLH